MNSARLVRHEVIEVRSESNGHTHYEYFDGAGKFLGARSGGSFQAVPAGSLLTQAHQVQQSVPSAPNNEGSWSQPDGYRPGAGI